MARYIFLGNIWSRGITLSIGETRSTDKIDGGNRPDITMTTRIEDNRVAVVVETEDTDVAFVRNQVESTVIRMTSVVAFLTGCAFDAAITHVVDVDGNMQTFHSSIPGLAKRNSERYSPEWLHKLLPLCSGAQGRYLSRCFDDLQLAMHTAVDTGFFCFRAIESLKQSFRPPDAEPDDKAEWRAMADATKKTVEHLQLIKKYAHPARHGMPIYISDADRLQVFLDTWDIVDAYIQYRLDERRTAAATT